MKTAILVLAALAVVTFSGAVGHASALTVWAGQCQWSDWQGCHANNTILGVTVLGDTGGSFKYCENQCA